MIQVHSLGNERVRRVLALQRSTRRRLRENLMVTEGLRLVDELARSSSSPLEVFVTRGFPESGDEAADLVRRVEDQAVLVEVTDEIMAAMAATVTPQGILAVAPIPDLSPLPGTRLILVPDRVRDPGNLGTMLRTAWAAGVTEVLLPPGTVDATNPKVVRAGMGAHFHVPVHTADWESIWQRVGDVQAWLAEAGRGRPYDAVDWRGEAALIIGGEAAGAGPWARQCADSVHIPMAPGVESLNAGVAAAVILFEASKQRRAPKA